MKLESKALSLEYALGGSGKGDRNVKMPSLQSRNSSLNLPGGRLGLRERQAVGRNLHVVASQMLHRRNLLESGISAKLLIKMVPPDWIEQSTPSLPMTC